MMFRPLLGAALLLASALSVTAQVRPEPGNGDPRLQSILYQPNQVVLIEAAPGYQVTVELAPDEQIEIAAVGDSGAWQVTANRAGNRLFIKPLQAGMNTNMTVITNVRSYAFDLSAVSGGGSATPYTVQFRYAAQPDQQQLVAPKQPSAPRLYRTSGDRSLKPRAIHDDGIHTFIEWPADAALPATYAVNEAGVEQLVNGNMRGGIYVLDSIAERLLFRIDDRTARADRIRAPKASK